MPVVVPAGSVSPGQRLTPNPNVPAPAGMGGDVWGANGGGAVPMGGQKPVIAAICDAEFAATYLPPTPAPPRSVLSAESNTSLSGQTTPSLIPNGGSNAG